MTQVSKGRFGQVITAMITPFRHDGSVDEEAVPKLVNHLLENGSDGIVVCGTTGESPTLTHSEKLRLFKQVKQIVAGRGTVLAGTGSNDTQSTIDFGREAEELGVDGLLIVGPYYSRPSQDGYYCHFRAAAEAVKIPVMLYNVPTRTAGNIDAATILRLARDVENIVAVKEAGGNISQMTEIAADAPEGFELYSGDDVMTLPLLAVGGVGVVSVTAHIVGRDMKAMHTAFFSGDIQEATRLHAGMLPICKALFQATTPSPAPLKCAMNLLGLPGGGLRLPLLETTAAETEIVRAALANYGLT